MRRKEKGEERGKREKKRGGRGRGVWERCERERRVGATGEREWSRREGRESEESRIEKESGREVGERKRKGAQVRREKAMRNIFNKYKVLYKKCVQ